MKKWTPEQEFEVVKAAYKNPNNLRQAFEQVSKKIDRTPSSVVTRYYNHIQNRYKNQFILKPLPIN